MNDPTLNGSSTLQIFECSNVIEICNRTIVDFYPGQPHKARTKMICLTVLPALLVLASTLLFFAGILPDVFGNSAAPNKTQT